MRGELADIRDGGIDDHDLCLIDADGFFDANGGQRIRLGDIGADQEHGFGFGQVFPVVRACGRYPRHAWRRGRN